MHIFGIKKMKVQKVMKRPILAFSKFGLNKEKKNEQIPTAS